MDKTTVLSVARELYETKPKWTEFFSKMLGVEGEARKVFKTPAEMAKFAKTDEYRQIRSMLSTLKGDSEVIASRSPQKVITVRMPCDLHSDLGREAAELNVSVNELAIAKLLYPADPEILSNHKKRSKK